MRGIGFAVLLCLTVGGIEAAEPTVRIGNQTKNTTGVVRNVESGDVACYLTLADARGREFTELAEFEICEMPSLIGKQVTLTYKLEKVIADECQGDPECTKTKTVPLVTAVKPLARTTFCSANETVVFSCPTGSKLVSVCAPKRGAAQYRFGKPDAAIELTIDGKSAAGDTLMFSGGGGAWLRFHNGDHSYVVYSAIGKWGPRGEPRDKSGVAVERNGKLVRNLACTGKVQSELGPDWFELARITSKGEEFELPE
jgi:hypothetical protein